MPFSKLFSLLLLLGIIPIIVGSVFGLALYAFLVYNAILVMLLIADIIITPGKHSFEVERVCEEKFSLGAENKVIIQVRNNGRYQLTGEFRDEVPLFLRVSYYSGKITLKPHYYSEGIYRLIPEKRGEFEFGLIHLWYTGVLKLCRKAAAYDCRRSYKVYPNLKDLEKLNFAALKKSRLMAGVKKVKDYGIGTEFESLREYSEGDDFRKINWMATARANKLIVNTYEPEKNQNIFILLDSSRVMNAEINYIKKLDYAINSAFLLAEIALKKQDKIGLMVFDSNIKRFVKPGKGAGHFQLIADNLYNVEENFVTADYRGALTYLNQNHKRRSLLCIFTELFNAQEAIQLALALRNIAQNHIPLVITIKDERIEEVIEQDIKETKDIFTKSAALKLNSEREKIARVFADFGIACIDVPPDRLSIETVNKYLVMKSTMQI